MPIRARSSRRTGRNQRGIRLLVRIVAAASSTLIVSGCASTVIGTATATGESGAPAPAYASKLDDSDRATLAYNAQIRALDPCGYLDEKALKKLGVVRQFDASATASDCQARIDVQRDPNKQLEISLTILPKDNGYAAKATKVTVAGTSVQESIEYAPGATSSAINTCRNLVAFDDKSSIALSVFRRTSDAACTEAHQLIEASLPLIAHRPQRTDSTRKARHAISMQDPCAALKTLTADHEITLSTLMPSPWRCSFNVDGATATSGRDISLRTNSKDGYKKPYGDATRITVEGNPATQAKLSSQCLIDVWVGDPKTGITYDPVGDPKYTSNTVSVSASSCDVASQTAALAVKAFLDD